MEEQGWATVVPEIVAPQSKRLPNTVPVLAEIEERGAGMPKALYKFNAFLMIPPTTRMQNVHTRSNKAQESTTDLIEDEQTTRTNISQLVDT